MQLMMNATLNQYCRILQQASGLLLSTHIDMYMEVNTPIGYDVEPKYIKQLTAQTAIYNLVDRTVFSIDVYII